MGKKTIYTILLLGLPMATYGHKTPGMRSSSKTTQTHRAGTCAPATSRTQLELNNVRALIETGGRMWQDRSTSSPSYEVPKGSNRFAIYAGALWMGGTDAAGQLRVAANMFGQGNDFWSGPLQTDGTANISSGTCEQWDKFHHITKAEVELFLAWHANPQDYPDYPGPPESIKNWPAHGGVGEDFYLAPFHDVNGNGVYEWEQGDYPDYGTISGNNPCNFCAPNSREQKISLFGDETYWWIFNDNGNIHTESGGANIGMEIRAQAFAFATNDEVNNMTFYNYQMINRSTITLHNTYFAQWVDPDLGDYQDDYVGCDVARGLGYAYNGDAEDGTPNGYGSNPPAIGVDFFQGPYMDYDGIDNPGPTKDNNFTVSCADAVAGNGIVYKGIGVGYGDGCIDNERYGMRSFYYFTGQGATSAGMSDPDVGNPVHFYNYLTGKWRDGQLVTYGHNGYGGSGIQTNYCFPGDSDPLGWATSCQPQPEWTEVGSGLAYGDRRFVQSAGPFTLEPGAVNNITVGVVYARAGNGDPMASVELLKIADDKAQALFDNCFELMDGPDAPDMDIQELDRELIITLSNNENSNNVNETYQEEDPFLPDQLVDYSGNTYEPDPTYHFQGYIVYQLKNKEVSVADLDDIDLARPIYQCDIKDGVSRLINFEHDAELGLDVPVEKVDGADKGIKHAFKVTEDLFADGDRRLVNHRKYYYMAIAYAHNNYKDYDPSDPTTFDGQKIPFVSSRKAAIGAIKHYTGIPHIPAPEAWGTIAMAEFGDGPEITRIEGQCNGGLQLRFTEDSEEDIVNNHYKEHPTYQGGRGPVSIYVVDPLNVPQGDFMLKFVPDSLGNYSDNSTWELHNLSTGDTVHSVKAIGVDYEQIIPEWGIAVHINEPVYESDGQYKYTDLIHADIEFEDSSALWLTGVPDADNNTFQNWIRLGTQYQPPFPDWEEFNLDADYENLVGGTWAAYKTLYDTLHNPAPGAYYSGSRTTMKVADYHSVDIVLTKDKTKWTRCPVIQTNDYNHRGVAKGDMHNGPSLDQWGNVDGTGTGMSWFPGYAIDLETGERLNMAFGEDTWLDVDNGRNMMWDPSSTLTTALGEPVYGGKQYIYVFKNRENNGYLGRYNGGSNIESLMQTSPIKVWRSCMWVGMPLLAEESLLLESDARITIQLAKAHEERNIFGENNGLPMYEFSLNDLATTIEDLATAESALDLINVVPNPYYGFSKYEVNKLDNRVRFTNLPPTCTINIYTVGGTLVRQLSKDTDAITSVDWDLKNFKGIPIASGAYIVHIEAPGLGERVIKWFGALRPPDLENF